MERDERKILAVVQILRRVTRIVKTSPFVLAALYLFSMIGYMLFSDSVSIVLDYLFYVSPSTIAILLLLSRATKMCIWHKLQCVLPLVALLPGMFDDLIMTLTNAAVYVNASMIAFICLASLINAYFVFIKPRNEKSNS